MHNNMSPPIGPNACDPVHTHTQGDEGDDSYSKGDYSNALGLVTKAHMGVPCIQIAAVHANTPRQ